MFKGILLRELDGKVSAALEDIDEAQLPAGDVTVDVQYSTLNYKDGMILKGMGRLVRQYPHVPGVDFAGKISASSAPGWNVGDEVILTGWRVGETHWGGYAQKARVQSDWLVKLPAGMSTKQAMAIGTAGFTAMLAVMALQQHGVTPDKGEVLVTGAAGGVGSVAVAVLHRLGYTVAASTGRPETHDYLKSLGASSVVDRATLAVLPARPMESERWAGCVDAVGGPTLANVLASLKHRGSAASCGLAGGNKLETTVIPFLLRGVNLLGIDSVSSPRPERETAWSRLAKELDPRALEIITSLISLEDLPGKAGDILAGKVRGRLVVEVNR
ncbi:MAG TPA: MDR family oxidoreductase [Dongiaceae bacterium]